MSSIQSFVRVSVLSGAIAVGGLIAVPAAVNAATVCTASSADCVPVQVLDETITRDPGTGADGTNNGDQDAATVGPNQAAAGSVQNAGGTQVLAESVERSTTASGNVAFTGANIAGAAGLGAVLMAIGGAFFAVRRTTRSRA